MLSWPCASDGGRVNPLIQSQYTPFHYSKSTSTFCSHVRRRKTNNGMKFLNPKLLMWTWMEGCNSFSTGNFVLYCFCNYCIINKATVVVAILFYWIVDTIFSKTHLRWFSMNTIDLAWDFVVHVEISWWYTMRSHTHEQHTIQPRYKTIRYIY